MKRNETPDQQTNIVRIRGPRPDINYCSVFLHQELFNQESDRNGISDSSDRAVTGRTHGRRPSLSFVDEPNAIYRSVAFWQCAERGLDKVCQCLAPLSENCLSCAGIISIIMHMDNTDYARRSTIYCPMWGDAHVSDESAYRYCCSVCMTSASIGYFRRELDLGFCKHPSAEAHGGCVVTGCPHGGSEDVNPPASLGRSSDLMPARCLPRISNSQIRPKMLTNVSLSLVWTSC